MSTTAMLPPGNGGGVPPSRIVIGPPHHHRPASNVPPHAHIILPPPLADDQAPNTHRITLHKPEDGAGLGFMLRGGVEHGLGHFVSAVEPGSEAHLQGLRPGDQILKVDGMSLLGATHKEVVALISSRHYRFEMEVRSVGMIPVKNKTGDPVTWKAIEMRPETRISVPQIRPSEHLETRVVISITGQQGLGCSICKGPSSKPGIFVQSTKPGGLAREAGLRPGDQILDCNGISFQRLDFSEAVFQLKSSRHLDLLLRKGAGADLFPSESSGYDSSSSSSAGELSRRVSNENLRNGHSINGNGAIIEATNQLVASAKLSKSASNLSLTTKPADVTENRIKLEEKLIEEERKRLESEQERLRRESIKLEAERKRFEEEKKMALTKTTSITSTTSGETTSSTASTNGLAGAIQNELQRRALKQKAPQAPPVPNSKVNFKKTPLATLKNDKHDALMAEFKRAHKKMFNSSTDEDDEEENGNGEKNGVAESADTSGSPRDFSSDVSLTGSGSTSSNITTSCTSNEMSIPSSSGEETEQTSASPSPTSKPKAPPPPPPERVSSITPSTSPIGTEKKEPKSAFKPTFIKNGQRAKTSSSPLSSSSPGIPTPDYDSTPERSPTSYRRRSLVSAHHQKHYHRPGALRVSTSMSSLLEPTSSQPSPRSHSPYHSQGTIQRGRLQSAKSFQDFESAGLTAPPPPPQGPPPSRSRDRAFSRRHPDIDVGSLDSFSIGDTLPKGNPKPPPFYFEPAKRSSPLVPITAYVDKPDPVRFDFLPQPQAVPKTVRFNFGEEGRLASQDYRMLANGTNGNHLQVELVKTLNRSGLRQKSSTPPMHSSPSPTSSSASSRSMLSDEDVRSRGGPRSSPPGPPRSPKKTPAPPPPPPPPKETMMSIDECVDDDKDFELVEHTV